jgi:dihydroxyacetone kinase-like protein
MTSPTPSTLPELIKTIQNVINENADEVAELDAAIGDGDHVVNLQRGLSALEAISPELSQLDWPAAYLKIGMTLMSTMGGASGSLFGTLFVSMSKTAKTTLDFAELFASGVESVKQRGKADLGEKTMLDTLIPVSKFLYEQKESDNLEYDFQSLKQIAYDGMLSTENMLATKGRASFLGERAIGHIDAGARTSQLMIWAIADYLSQL